MDYVQYIYTHTDKHPTYYEDLSFPSAVYDRDGVIIRVNEIFRQIAGITPDHIQLGKVNIFDCLNGDCAGLVEAAHHAFDVKEKAYEDMSPALHTKSEPADKLLADFPNAMFFPMAYDKKGVKHAAILLDKKDTGTAYIDTG